VQAEDPKNNLNKNQEKSEEIEREMKLKPNKRRKPSTKRDNTQEKK